MSLFDRNQPRNKFRGYENQRRGDAGPDRVVLCRFDTGLSQASEFIPWRLISLFFLPLRRLPFLLACLPNTLRPVPLLGTGER